MANLSREQKKSFIEANLLQGLVAEELMIGMSHPAFEKDQVVFSADPSSGDLPGKLVPIPTFDDLFKMLGLPQSEKNALPVMSPVYPCEAVVIAGEDLYIKSGQVIKVGDADHPTVLIFGSITVETGGQLLTGGNTAVNCQVFTQL
jgi:hypothetical protein